DPMDQVSSLLQTSERSGTPRRLPSRCSRVVLEALIAQVVMEAFFIGSAFLKAELPKCHVHFSGVRPPPHIRLHCRPHSARRTTADRTLGARAHAFSRTEEPGGGYPFA